MEFMEHDHKALLVSRCLYKALHGNISRTVLALCSAKLLSLLGEPGSALFFFILRLVVGRHTQLVLYPAGPCSY